MSENKVDTPKKVHWKRIWAGVGGLVGILGLLQQLTGFTIAGPGADQGPSQNPAPLTSESTLAAAPTFTSTATPTSIVDAPTPSDRTSTPTSAQPLPPPTDPVVATPYSPAVNSLIIETKLGEPVTVGKKLGPNSYALGFKGEADITYRWTGYSSSGTEMNGTNCQMVATITGPQVFPPYKTATCSERFASSFGGPPTGLDITTPGTYTIYVKDELTGATGSASFTVAP